MTQEHKHQLEFLTVVAVAFLLWLLLRKRHQLAAQGPTVTQAEPGLYPPDYLTYNVPAMSKTSLPDLNVLSPDQINLTGPTVNLQVPGAASPCNCASTQPFFASLQDMVNTYVKKASALEATTLLNIASAFPASALYGAAGANPGPARLGPTNYISLSAV